MADKENVLFSAVYIVNLSRVYWGRRTNRADRAVKLLREFVRRHTKADKVIIHNDVNNYIWSRGREKPPRRITVYVRVIETEESEEEKEKEKKLRIAKVKLAFKKRKPGIIREEKAKSQ